MVKFGKTMVKFAKENFYAAKKPRLLVLIMPKMSVYVKTFKVEDKKIELRFGLRLKT